VTHATIPGDLPPDVLDKMRRGIAMRMGPMGNFTLDGEAITHVRVLAVLRAGLDITASGEITVRIGTQWCYLTVDDCPLRVLAVTGSGAEPPQMRLDDGRSVPLDPHTLWDEPERGLRCTAPAADSGRPLPVRFTNRAQMDLAAWLDIADSGSAALVLGAQRYPIPSSAPSPT